MKPALTLLALAISMQAQAARTISANGIVLSTVDHDAGAVCSLVYRGKQYINDYDKGRCLQSAVSFDHMGESFNPTEAGASSLTDGLNYPVARPSSSKLTYESSAGATLETRSQMAFWNPYQGVKLSGHRHHKVVTIGYGNLPNVIKFDIDFTAPDNESHVFGQYEVLTAYTGPEFSKFQTVTCLPLSCFASPLSAIALSPEQPKPVFSSTPDGSSAIGLYVPPRADSVGYGRWLFSDTSKINAVIRFAGAPIARTQAFTAFVIVGTRAEVIASMSKLDQSFNVLSSKVAAACR